MIISNRKAFTLIELLVVVLIIGILAAIAFPKYQLAVEKTRATNRVNLATSIARPAYSYILANSGKMPKNLSDLDINPPLKINEPNISILFNAHGEVEIKPTVTSGSGTYYTIFAGLKNNGYRFQRGALHCYPMRQGNAELARKVCESLCNGKPFQTVSGIETCIIAYI